MIRTFATMVAVTTLLAGTPAVIRAEGGSCPMCACKMDAGKKVDKLSLVLDLNDKQKGQVKDLVDAKKKKVDPALQQFETAYKSAADQFETDLKKILTAAQQKKFDAWKETKEDKGH